MRAVVVPVPGGPDALTWAEVPDPEPAPGEVVIEVAAAGVNRADLLQRQGVYPPPKGAPPYPGLECSGVITAIGSNVRRHVVGQQVCALLQGGGYAEKVAVHESLLLPVPNGVSLVDAAALPEVACTVWANVFGQAHLAAGETLLVHGGSGGVGTFAVQLGHVWGSRVCATARAETHEALRELGAEVCVDYRDEDFVAVLNGLGGADVILDNMGASYLDRNLDALAMDGRLVIIGMQGGRRHELDLNRLFTKRATVHAALLRSRPLTQRASIVDDVVRHVWPDISKGAVRPVVHARIPMADAPEAHRIVAHGGHVGKVLLVRD